MSKVTLAIYRDLSNRIAGEPDDGPIAWKAHRKRPRVIEDVFADKSFRKSKTDGRAEDTSSTHELAELVIEIVKEPTVQIALSATAVYIGKVVAKQFDDIVGRGVRHLFQKLYKAFTGKKIGDYWITLPDDSRIVVAPDSQITITLRGGKPVNFHFDSPPG